MDKRSEDIIKTAFIKKFETFLVRVDENSAIFEFHGSPRSQDWHALHQVWQSFLLQLELLFTDYQIVAVKRSGHPLLQVQLRLEEGLWKPK